MGPAPPSSSRLPPLDRGSRGERRNRGDGVEKTKLGGGEKKKGERAGGWGRVVGEKGIKYEIL
jgi:hypothetical protein